ncbi:MAG: Bax inhibitor-1/YccA family protein [Ahrensia sp.]
MADYRNLGAQAAPAGTMDASVDLGLRAYMLRVYNLMALGLGITALFAAGTMLLAVTDVPNQYALPGDARYLTAFGAMLFATPLKWVIMLAPLGLVFFMGFKIQSVQPSTAQAIFWGFAALMGVSMSSIFLVYTPGSIVQTFLITATAFGALSIYGYTTKRDLTAVGSFMFMGLIGIILAAIVNIFLQSSMLQFAISAIGVLVFAGLTAYDTQKTKEMYYALNGEEMMGRAAVMAALSLYLDFINMFQFLLYFLGNRE